MRMSHLRPREPVGQFLAVGREALPLLRAADDGAPESAHAHGVGVSEGWRARWLMATGGMVVGVYAKKRSVEDDEEQGALHGV